MSDKSRNTWLCVHWQWNTLEWCQLNALQASPVVHLVTPLSCVSFSMNTQPSVPAIRTCRKLVMVGRTDQRTHVQVKRDYFRLRTDGRTDGQPENIMPLAPKGGGITIEAKLVSTLYLPHWSSINLQHAHAAFNATCACCKLSDDIIQNLG